MSKLERLVMFVTVVEENSFIGAAKKLRMTNAAISKQITALEKALGTLLLTRTTRQLSLTEAGQIYFEHAKEVIQGMKEMDALFSDMRSEPSGHLRVCTVRHFAKCYIIPHLQEFYACYPKISIDLEFSETMPNLLKEGIDINIGNAMLGALNDVHRKIAETRYVYCASPAYFEKHGIPKKPEDLIKHRYITHMNRRPDNVLKFNKNKIITVNPFMRINDAEMIKQCALEGLGIIKLHQYAVREYLQTGELKEVLQGFDNEVHTIYLRYPECRYIPPKTRHFIDFFVKKVERETY